MRRIIVSNITSYNSDAAIGCILSGIADAPLEDIKISNLYMQHKGGGSAGQAKLVPPEQREKYPDPGMFGPMPAQGFFLRHIRNLEMSHVEVTPMTADARPAFVLTDVTRADFIAVTAPTTPAAFALRSSTDVRVHISRAAENSVIKSAIDRTL